MNSSDKCGLDTNSQHCRQADLAEEGAQLCPPQQQDSQPVGLASQGQDVCEVGSVADDEASTSGRPLSRGERSFVGDSMVVMGRLQWKQVA